MRKVTDAESLLIRIGEILKAGMISNSMPDADDIRKETEKGALYAEEYDNGVILLHRRESFDRLDWMLVRGSAIPEFHPERTTVLEYPYRGRDKNAPDINRQWQENGFGLELQRVRLTRKAGDVETDHTGIEAAGPEDLDHITRLLHDNFPELTGCIPEREALIEDIANGNILKADGGLLHFSRSGRSSEIRHLAVALEFRNQGMASGLVKEYLSRCGDGICRVWTGKDNTAALELYRMHGFTEDGWRSDVRVYRKEL